MKSFHLDNRRQLIIPGDAEKTIAYAVEDWIQVAKQAIQDHDFFSVALSGGSTPKRIFQQLAEHHQNSLAWSKVLFFWSDERNVLPSDPMSNFHMAMIQAGLTKLNYNEKHIYRMVAEKDCEINAKAYEKLILTTLKQPAFDLVMLGMGDDGHTASLFPHTKALQAKELVVANYIPQKQTWRMSFTFNLINQAHHIRIYALGQDKADMLQKVLFSSLDINNYPVQNVGTEQNRAFWVIDQAAAQKLALT